MSDQQPALPWYHKPRTNGPNDLDYSSGNVIDPQTGKITDEIDPSRTKQIQKELRTTGTATFNIPRSNRNELGDEIIKSWEHENIDPENINRFDPDKVYSPLYCTKPYELLRDWIPRQTYIEGCVYDLSDGSLLEEIARVCETGYASILVDKRPWFIKSGSETSDAKEKRERVFYWFDKIKSVWIFDSDDLMVSMHQKWIIG